jgi:hypothetical protein
MISTSCSKAKTHKVKVKFTNLTGNDLTNLKIGNEHIGKLSANQTTDFVLFKEFNFDSGWPFESIHAKINGVQICDYKFSDCGTERSTVEQGTYEMELLKIDNSDESFLRLRLK